MKSQFFHWSTDFGAFRINPIPSATIMSLNVIKNSQQADFTSSLVNNVGPFI